MQKLFFNCGGIKEILDVIEKRQKPIIDFLNAYSVFLFKENPRFRNSITDHYYIYPDGISISFFYFFKHRKRLPRTPGPIFTEFFLRQENVKEKRHFFLGLDKEDVEKIVKNFKCLSMKSVSYYNPPYIKGDTFSNKEINKIIKLINREGVDYLWVGLGNPKKEILASQILDKIKVKCVFLIGAALDFLSNKKSWAPSVIRKLGLEWAFRLITDFSYSKRKVWGSFLSLFFMRKYIDFKE